MARKIIYTIMALNGFCEPIRVKRAPRFLTRKGAEEYIKASDYGEYYWIEEQDVGELDEDTRKLLEACNA